MTNLVDRDQMTDREKELVDYWLEKGREHATPSKLTQKFMGEINTHLQYIKEALKQNKEDIKEISKNVSELPGKLDCKYADKGIEEEVKALKEKQEARVYDWLKYLITAIVGGAITYFIK